jgi:putative toxin-antitoxin system antitoxin component (TIGR02293 family)
MPRRLHKWRIRFMAKKFSELEDKMPPESKARVAARVKDTLHVMARAEEVLGDQEKATRWLGTPNRVLEDKTPMEILSTDGGARRVEVSLGKIAEGIYS